MTLRLTLVASLIVQQLPKQLGCLAIYVAAIAISYVHCSIGKDNTIAIMDCSSWPEVKKLTTCAIYENIFEKPHTLFCCHTFCELCIKPKKKYPSCPEDFAGNKLFTFKAVCFENLYLSRLAAIF